jgi:uncharacterized protein (DUF427 family)
MDQRQPTIPGPDHPISVQKNPARVRVTAGGAVIAETSDALLLREANYPPVNYVPRKDADMALLERTHHTTYCPYKGECAYYSITAAGPAGVNAVWSYENPYPAVAEIAGHFAFYPNRVEISEVPAG